MENKNQNVVIFPPCGENVALATKRGANKQNLFGALLPRLTALLPPQGQQITTGGFTLIELLVVVLIIGILNNGLNLMGINSNWQYIVKGVVILAAVYIDVIRNNKKTS